MSTSWRPLTPTRAHVTITVTDIETGDTETLDAPMVEDTRLGSDVPEPYGYSRPVARTRNPRMSFSFLPISDRDTGVAYTITTTMKGQKLTKPTPPKHPMQPIELDSHDVVRFRANSVIRWLVDTGRLDLDEVNLHGFGREDIAQVMQLLGYSVSGFGDLQCASDEVMARADAEAALVLRTHGMGGAPS